LIVKISLLLYLLLLYDDGYLLMAVSFCLFSDGSGQRMQKFRSGLEEYLGAGDVVEGCYKGQVLALLVDDHGLVGWRIIGSTAISLLADILHKLFLLQLLGKLVEKLCVEANLLQKSLRKAINS
jgi:hypothetical protein